MTIGNWPNRTLSVTKAITEFNETNLRHSDIRNEMDLSAHPIFKHSGWHWTRVGAMICFAATATILIVCLASSPKADANAPYSQVLLMTP